MRSVREIQTLTKPCSYFVTTKRFSYDALTRARFVYDNGSVASTLPSGVEDRDSAPASVAAVAATTHRELHKVVREVFFKSRQNIIIINEIFRQVVIFRFLCNPLVFCAIFYPTSTTVQSVLANSKSFSFRCGARHSCCPSAITIPSPRFSEFIISGLI